MFYNFVIIGAKYNNILNNIYDESDKNIPLTHIQRKLLEFRLDKYKYMSSDPRSWNNPSQCNHDEIKHLVIQAGHLIRDIKFIDNGYDYNHELHIKEVKIKYIKDRIEYDNEENCGNMSKYLEPSVHNIIIDYSGTFNSLNSNYIDKFGTIKNKNIFTFLNCGKGWSFGLPLDTIMAIITYNLKTSNNFIEVHDNIYMYPFLLNEKYMKIYYKSQYNYLGRLNMYNIDQNKSNRKDLAHIIKYLTSQKVIEPSNNLQDWLNNPNELWMKTVKSYECNKITALLYNLTQEEVTI